ncbi:MAG TPA: dihydrofolate reductase family protein [Candidatus Limnocylindria bacterium]|nr:dihydrofolate reductase family protein [Candidatus Limnocylindria bacterium]
MASRIRFSAAMSLDGYLAGPAGEADWIVPDPETDFSALMAQFDTLLVGRRTFETMVRAKRTTMPGMRTVVLSTTLRQVDYPDVTIVGDEVEAAVKSLRANSRKDVWLFGGGELFRRLLDAGLVDSVELAVEPILLGGGIPLVREALHRHQLRLAAHRVSKVGVVHLEYVVTHPAA